MKRRSIKEELAALDRERFGGRQKLSTRARQPTDQRLTDSRKNLRELTRRIGEAEREWRKSLGSELVGLTAEIRAAARTVHQAGKSPQVDPTLLRRFRSARDALAEISEEIERAKNPALAQAGRKGGKRAQEIRSEWESKFWSELDSKRPLTDGARAITMRWLAANPRLRRIPFDDAAVRALEMLGGVGEDEINAQDTILGEAHQEWLERHGGYEQEREYLDRYHRYVPREEELEEAPF